MKLSQITGNKCISWRKNKQANEQTNKKKKNIHFELLFCFVLFFAFFIFIFYRTLDFHELRGLKKPNERTMRLLNKGYDVSVYRCLNDVRKFIDPFSTNQTEVTFTQ